MPMLQPEGDAVIQALKRDNAERCRHYVWLQGTGL